MDNLKLNIVLVAGLYPVLLTKQITKQSSVHLTRINRFTSTSLLTVQATDFFT